MLFLLIAPAASAQPVPQAPGRDPALLHRHVEQQVGEKEREQEQTLRSMLTLGGSSVEQAEVTARLAALLRARGLAAGQRAQAAADAGDEAGAAKEKKVAEDARAEAVARYRELLQKYPDAPRQDEALFFLADTLQDSGREPEAVLAARDLTARFPRSLWAPASHVFIGEHLFDEAKLDEALKEYRAAAEVPKDEVYPYALYKAAWCRFNQSGFLDAMKLFKRVVEVSTASAKADASKVQLAREARRDYVIAYGRVGKPETAKDEFSQKFGAEASKKMLEQYGKVLFDTGRDQEAQLVSRQLLVLHGDEPAAALDQTRLLVLAQRGGKRKDTLREADALVKTFGHINKEKGDALDEANRLGEETLRTLSVETHNEARKTDLDDTWSAAHSLYTDYLALFPEDPNAYELRFFDGELLYARGRKAEAAALYEAVVRQDVQRQKDKQPVGRWLTKASWSAVLSRDEAIHGQAEQKDTGERRSQRALTPDEEKLAAACLLYLEAMPDGPHAVEVAFKVGRLEYTSSQLDAAEKHLSSIALGHPEHELAEYAANLVLDISNIRKDWPALHGWAVRFLEDKKLSAHGTLAVDLKRIEEESAYAVADGEPGDAGKAKALLAFVDEHPHGALADKAIFGAAAALSRQGLIDEALTARARLWKEQQGSPLVPRALVASAADFSAVGDLGEAAGLLEKYAAGFKKQEDNKKWRREHPPAHPPAAKKPEATGPVYEEAKAQSGLHDAAVLREARGELRLALQDRALSLAIWKKTDTHDEDVLAQTALRAKVGEVSRAAREYAGLAKEMKGKPGLQLAAWHQAAKLFTRLKETGNAMWSWTEIERLYKSVGPKAREKLPPDAVTAAADAHFALGSQAFEDFRKAQVKAPLMITLNRKIALLQKVKKRTEETVAMRQAEAAVCALAQLGEAQMLLGQAIAQSPVPPGLKGEQRKLYRDAIGEKALPLYAEAKETLHGADDKTRELGVTGACPARVTSILGKLGDKVPPRPQLDLEPEPVAPPPDLVDADGQVVAAGDPQ